MCIRDRGQSIDSSTDNSEQFDTDSQLPLQQQLFIPVTTTDREIGVQFSVEANVTTKRTTGNHLRVGKHARAQPLPVVSLSILVVRDDTTAHTHRSKHINCKPHKGHTHTFKEYWLAEQSVQLTVVV